MLKVFCPEGELVDNDDSLAVGDVVDRLGQVRRSGELFSGTALEHVSWQFDRAADPDLGRMAVLSGTIASVHAVYASMTVGPEGGWRRRRGSVRLEPRTATAGTVRPTQRVQWTSSVSDEATGTIARAGFGTSAEGDEVLEGWLLTLADEHVREIDIEPV